MNTIYLLYGEETFLLDKAFKRIKKSFDDLIIGINYITLENTSSDKIIADIQTPSFGFDKKLIVVKNTDFTKLEGLNTFLEENFDLIKDTICIVFIETKIDNRLKITKTLQALGTVNKFDFLKPIDAIKEIKNICDLYKVNITEKTLKYFIETCGLDMQNLVNEIRKLIDYVGENNEITVQCIDLLSIKQTDAIIFDLTDNLGNKNIKNSINILHDLIKNKEPIQKIVVSLYNHFKKLYLIKLANIYKKDPLEALKLKPNQMFLISKYTNQSKFFEEIDLRNILKNFLTLDVKSKTGNIDLQIGLEAIFCSI